MLTRNNLILIIIALIITASVSGLDIEIVTEQYPPFNYEQDGIVQGIATERVMAVLEELDIEADINVMRWSRAYRRALRRSNVLIYSIARTPEREEQFHWIGVVAPFEIYLYSLNSRDDIKIETKKDLQGLIIGVVEGDVRDQYFSRLEAVNISRFRNSRDVINALITGEIDLMPANRLNFPYIIKYLELSPKLFSKRFFVEDLSKDGLYIAFGKRTDIKVVYLFRNALNRVLGTK